MNIINYIKEHKDEDFKTFPLTEVDYLILSLTSYLDFTSIIPAFKKNKITLKECMTKFNKEKSKTKGLFISNTYKMLNIMQDTKRYGNILLYNYMNIGNGRNRNIK